MHGADIAASSELAGRLTVWRGQGDTLESRVAALEANFLVVRDDANHRDAELEQRLTQQSQRGDDLRAELDRQHAEREAERREQLRESATLQLWATGVFLIGAVLGGLANTC